jgi:hypothetical protein
MLKHHQVQAISQSLIEYTRLKGILRNRVGEYLWPVFQILRWMTVNVP